MITVELMTELFPYPRGLSPGRCTLANPAARARLVEAMNLFCPRYEINSYLRMAGFLGCTAVETDGYKTTVEYGGVAYFTQRYERRRAKAEELGNTEPGDGARFRGRGLMQTTGRDNYTRLNAAVGREVRANLVRSPERLAEIPLAVQSAAFYWKWAELGEYADAREWRQLNGKVNRGRADRTPLHWPQRSAFTERCLATLPTDFSFAPPEAALGASGTVRQ